MKDRYRFTDSSTSKDTYNNAEQKTITRTKLSLLETSASNPDICINSSNILFDYLDELDNCVYEYTMTTDEIDRYYMRPDLFAYDKWGDKDYSFLVLFINNIISPKEFVNTKVKMIRRELVSQLLGLIISSERDYLNYNRNNYESGAY